MLVILPSYNMTSTVSKVIARLFRFTHIKAWDGVGIRCTHFNLHAEGEGRSSPTQGVEPMEEEKDTGGKWGSSRPPALRQEKQLPLPQCIRGWMGSGTWLVSNHNSLIVQPVA
jgi:hypothetical protein